MRVPEPILYLMYTSLVPLPINEEITTFADKTVIARSETEGVKLPSSNCG